jgi:hypothetical protein
MPAVRSIDTKPDENLIEALEALVTAAREGKLIGFVAPTNYTASTGSSHGGFWQDRDALIAFELWKKRMLERYAYQED